MNITEFFSEILKSPLRHRIQAWGARDRNRDRYFLRVWEDEIGRDASGERVQVLKKCWSRSSGYPERRNQLDEIRKGAQAFGVVCRARVPNSSGKRKIKSFDQRQLLYLGQLVEEGDTVFARIVMRVPCEEVVGGSPVARDLEDVLRVPVATTRQALVSARVGQGDFRLRVLAAWDGKCAVTGSEVHSAIRASHIKPWCESTNEERLDPCNGLPLVASLDALFDAGLISFEDSGRMIVSSSLSRLEREIFGISDKKLRQKPTIRTAGYMEYHRKRLVA
jgi:putative restriction endonuclease